MVRNLSVFNHIRAEVRFPAFIMPSHSGALAVPWESHGRALLSRWANEEAASLAGSDIWSGLIKCWVGFVAEAAQTSGLLPFPLRLPCGFAKAHAKPSIFMKNWFLFLFQFPKWHNPSSLTAEAVLNNILTVWLVTASCRVRSLSMWRDVSGLRKDATVLRSFLAFASHNCSLFCLYIFICLDHQRNIDKKS